MAYRHPSHKIHKVMVQPINVIFRQLQNRTRVSIWLYEIKNMKIEGIVVGFDEYMNLVLNNAQEVVTKKGQLETRRSVGRILLKGDCVSLIEPVMEKNQDAAVA